MGRTADRRREDRARQRGASAVEFALVVPILISLLFGVSSVGLGYNQTIEIGDAAREGARFGATTPRTPGTWGSAVQDRTVTLAYDPAITSSNVCASLEKVGTGTLESSSCSVGAAPANPPGVVAGECVVKVWMQVPIDLNFLVLQYSITVERHSVARYERTC